jgi:LysM repeat protein
MFDTHARRRLTLLATVGTLLIGGLQFTAPSPGADRPKTYVVAPGDTLWTIATAEVDGDLRAAVAAIRDRNGLADVTLQVGQRLLVPTAV